MYRHPEHQPQAKYVAVKSCNVTSQRTGTIYTIQDIAGWDNDLRQLQRNYPPESDYTYMSLPMFNQLKALPSSDQYLYQEVTPPTTHARRSSWFTIPKTPAGLWNFVITRDDGACLSLAADDSSGAFKEHYGRESLLEFNPQGQDVPGTHDRYITPESYLKRLATFLGYTLIEKPKMRPGVTPTRQSRPNMVRGSYWKLFRGRDESLVIEVRVVTIDWSDGTAQVVATDQAQYIYNGWVMINDLFEPSPFTH
jgi:hypothetical protein